MTACDEAEACRFDIDCELYIGCSAKHPDQQDIQQLRAHVRELMIKRDRVLAMCDEFGSETFTTTLDGVPVRLVRATAIEEIYGGGR